MTAISFDPVFLKNETEHEKVKIVRSLERYNIKLNAYFRPVSCLCAS